MEKSENTLLKVLDIFTHFLLLNTMWIIACIPIITIFPATTALFGVARKWAREGIDAGLFSLFIKMFKENFKKSFMIGIIWTMVGFIIYYDFSILVQVDFQGKIIVYSLLMFMFILYVFTTIYVFYLLVNYELSLMHTIKNALFISISYFSHTLLYIGIIALVIATVFLVPIFLLIFASVLAFTLSYLFEKLADKIKRTKWVEV